MTDPIADFLTRIRNAVKANHKVVEAPGSKIKQEITKILYPKRVVRTTLYIGQGNQQMGNWSQSARHSTIDPFGRYIGGFGYGAFDV